MNELQQANYQAPQQPSYQVETGLGDVARALWRRKWIILILVPAFLVGAHFYTQHLPKQWQAEAQLLLVQRAEYGGQGAPDSRYTPPAPNSVATQIGMLRTAAMADRTLSWLKNQELTTGQSADTSQLSIGALQGAVSVSNPTDSQLINIAVLGTSRDQALLLTNAVVQSFAQWKTEEARKDVQKTIARLIPQTRIARRKMEEAKIKQLAYQKDHSLLDSGSQARIGLERLNTRTEAVANIQQELQGEQATVNSLTSQIAAASGAIQKGSIRDDSQTATLSARLSDLKLARADLARKVTPAYHGKLDILDAQIKDVQGQYDRALAATKNASNPTLQTLGGLQNSLNAAKTQLATISAKLADALRLQAEAQSKMTPLVQTGSTYDQIAQAAQEATTTYTGREAALVSAQLRESQINGDVQITQYAVAPDGPSKPNPALNTLLGGLLGLLTSLLLIFVIEQLDRRVRTEEQVERLGSGPILGALPRLSRGSLSLLNRKMLPVPVAESYSLTGANLQRVLGKPLAGMGRIVMVTSAQAGEGKSLTAAELARSLARSGKRVILIDADMRHPGLHALFDGVPESGLVEVLAGKAALDDALTESETPNLSVLFNSAARANSADIIVSPHMNSFLQTVRSRADIVVLDTPSCTVVDPLLLAPSVDYVLQVIDLGRANEDAVNSTSSVLSGLAPLGLFINRTSKKNAPAYEVARSFASTATAPGLPGGARPLSADHTLLMFRNTSGYAPHLNGASDPLAEHGADPHDLAIPLKSGPKNREEL